MRSEPKIRAATIWSSGAAEKVRSGGEMFEFAHDPVVESGT